jgi:hypothetical protein
VGVSGAAVGSGDGVADVAATYTRHSPVTIAVATVFFLMYTDISYQA